MLRITALTNTISSTKFNASHGKMTRKKIQQEMANKSQFMYYCHSVRLFFVHHCSFFFVCMLLVLVWCSAVCVCVCVRTEPVLDRNSNLIRKNIYSKQLFLRSVFLFLPFSGFQCRRFLFVTHSHRFQNEVRTTESTNKLKTSAGTTGSGCMYEEERERKYWATTEHREQEHTLQQQNDKQA